MRLAPLLSTTVVLGMAVAATIVACGGDDDGGGGGGGGGTNIDASVAVDAKVFMDAAAKMGLGTTCTMPTDCPADAPTCLATGSASPRFCSASCGTSSGSNMQPAGGNEICQMFTGTGGTPACVFYLPPTNNQYPWLCGILCGMQGSANLGNCPTGLTCQGNVCR